MCLNYYAYDFENNPHSILEVSPAVATLRVTHTIIIIYILYVYNYVAIGPLDPVATLINLTCLRLDNNQLNGQ